MAGIGLGIGIRRRRSSRGASVPAATGLTATVISDTRIDLAFTGTGDVKRSTDGVTYSVIASNQTDSYPSINLTAGTLYYYKISNAGGDSNVVSDVTTNTVTISDTFTGANGTHLHDHTMNTGQAWTIADDNPQIQNNKLSYEANGVFICTFDAAIPDLDFSVDLTIPDEASYLSAIFLRFQDSTHYWQAGVERDSGGTPYVYLNERTTANDQRLNVPITHEAATNTLRLICSANEFILFWKGVEVGRYSGTSLAINTLAGVMGYVSASYFNVITDNLVIVKSKNYLFYGDSITLGTGASVVTNRWTRLLSKNKVVGDNNLGVGSATLQQYAGEVVTSFEEIAPTIVYSNYTKYIFIHYGYNDCWVATCTAANFKTKLDAALVAMIANGVPTNKIVLLTPTYVESYGFGDITKLLAIKQAVIDTANKYGLKYIDVYTYMAANGGHALLDADDIHPNDAGHDAIADCIIAAL